LARRAYLRMETEKLRRNSLTGNAPIDAIPTGGNRSSTLYEAGIQFSLPVQNRVAEANLGADKALLRQQQLRVTQLESQVAAEVQNAITALHAAENAVDAATKARELQAQLLGAAQESFSAGYSTNISVIEQQTYLTQAQSTEVFAKAARLEGRRSAGPSTGKNLGEEWHFAQGRKDAGWMAAALIQALRTRCSAERLADFNLLTVPKPY